MTSPRPSIWLWLSAILCCGATFASRAGAAEVDFAHDVIPLLQKHCAGCHSNGTYKGGMSIDTRETLLETGVVEPGDSAASYLIDLVTSDDPKLQMPPKGDRLSKEEVDTLRRWIDADLPWEAGYSFKAETYRAPLKPRRPVLPAAEPDVDNPLDQIIFHYWKEHGVEPPKPISDAAFYRRASLDLVGLLPSADEVDAFVSDQSTDKRSALVRRLLDNQVAYTDHWITFWNDLLRNDYAGTGFIDGGRAQITGWLYDALLKNKPYDVFVRELISPTPASEGFAKGIIWRGQVNASQRPELQFSQNVGQVFLGVNLKCASCHDSFVDDWKLTDAYGLAAITSNEQLEIHRCDKPTGEIAKAYFLFPELGTVDAAAPREERLKQLAAIMTSPENGRLTRTVTNRLWHRLMGRGIVHPVDAMGSRPWNENLLDQLAVHLADSGYDLKKTLELIATSQVYGLASSPWDESAPVEDFVFAGPSPKRMTAEQFVDALAAITGTAPEQTENDELFVQSIKSLAGGTARPFVRAALVQSTPLMRTLGRPNREQVVTTRPGEVTTLEALELSNGEPLSDLLAASGQKLAANLGDLSPSEISRTLVRAALSREPTDEEQALLIEAIGDSPTPESLADALWCIVMLPEFQLVR
ncbi:PSD1 and planctomycete cytochrome C domain-containing protein [Lacipirellula limnantheis]|uniref:Planctomycete cytochrome C n=1 Tax=Lacipirellula limnantheis TaxID=2528024 RepID=A0A517U1X6_9BACT|nr:PSD1 and planctomycete cytochrome C domain-containing protein [Lacipirellula limnantheis]QDT74626.1 Planctomycete cytochrome C [Lacipirellula limnantheis]